MSKSTTSLSSPRPPIKSINRYIEHVIDDAMASMTWTIDNPMRPRYWTTLIGNDLLIDIEPLYVNSRGNSYLVNKILYRLANNMTKNFGVNPNFPGEAPLISRVGYELTTPYDLRSTNHGYDYRNTLAKVTVFDEPRYLTVPNSYIWGDDTSYEEYEHIVDEFDRHGFHECDDPTFEVFEDVVKEIFRHTPMELWEYQLTHNHSVRGIVPWMDITEVH